MFTPKSKGFWKRTFSEPRARSPYLGEELGEGAPARLDLSIDSLLELSPRRETPLPFPSSPQDEWPYGATYGASYDLTQASPEGSHQQVDLSGVSPLTSEAPDDHAQRMRMLTAAPADGDVAKLRQERAHRRISAKLTDTAAPKRCAKLGLKINTIYVFFS